MAYVAPHSRNGCTYDGEVTTDGSGLGGEGVGGTEDLAAGLDGITALPDHGADGAGAHVGDESREEGLLGEVLVVLLKVLLGGGGKLDGGKLEATALEARDDGADETAHHTVGLDSDETVHMSVYPGQRCEKTAGVWNTSTTSVDCANIPDSKTVSCRLRLTFAR